MRAPGAILHVRSPKLGAWTGLAGLGRVAPDVPMRPADRFRAGSIAKLARSPAPAGGYALVTTVQDLARFLDALLAGRLVRHRATLRSMLDLASAQGEGGVDGYGLGIERRALPGGAELVGPPGGTTGYRSFVGRWRAVGVTLTFALNAEDDPTPVVIPAVRALATRR